MSYHKAFNLEKIREALKGAKIVRRPGQRLIDLGYRGAAEAREPQLELRRNGRASREAYGEPSLVPSFWAPATIRFETAVGPFTSTTDTPAETGRGRDSDDITVHQGDAGALTQNGIHQTRPGPRRIPSCRESRIVIGDTEEEEDGGG